MISNNLISQSENIFRSASNTFYNALRVCLSEQEILPLKKIAFNYCKDGGFFHFLYRYPWFFLTMDQNDEKSTNKIGK